MAEFRAYCEFYGRGSWMVREWNVADGLLSSMYAELNSVAIFRLSDGSWVTCAGARDSMMIEARVAVSSDQFRLYRFGKGTNSGELADIFWDSGHYRVDVSQVLTIDDARLIVRHFVESIGAFHPSYFTEDITNRHPRRTIERDDPSPLN